MKKSTYLLGIVSSIILTILQYIFYKENYFIPFGIFSFINGALFGILLLTFSTDLFESALKEEKQELESKILN